MFYTRYLSFLPLHSLTPPPTPTRLMAFVSYSARKALTEVLHDLQDSKHTGHFFSSHLIWPLSNICHCFSLSYLRHWLSLLPWAFSLLGFPTGSTFPWPLQAHPLRGCYSCSAQGSILGPLLFYLCPPPLHVLTHTHGFICHTSIHMMHFIYLYIWFSMHIFWLVLPSIHWILMYNYLLEISTWISQGYLNISTFTSPRSNYWCFILSQSAYLPGSVYWWMAPSLTLHPYHAYLTLWLCNSLAFSLFFKWPMLSVFNLHFTPGPIFWEWRSEIQNFFFNCSPALSCLPFLIIYSVFTCQVFIFMKSNMSIFPTSRLFLEQSLPPPDYINIHQNFLPVLLWFHLQDLILKPIWNLFLKEMK